MKYAPDQVTAFARGWCRFRNIPAPLAEDLVQEAHLVAVQCGFDRRAIAQGMDRYRKREYVAPMSISSMGGGLDADDFPEGAIRPDDMGLRHDSYHGLCRDDV